MAREEKEAYESYKLLNIPEEMAEAWKQEIVFFLVGATERKRIKRIV